MKALKTVLCWLLLSVCALAADPSEKVDDYIATQMKAQQIPGLSLAVVKDGKVVKMKGYGFSNLEHNVPVKPETMFQSGSVGKQFTAAAVLMLVEEGKVGLEDPISRYFANPPDSWKNITVRNLLSHTSGIPNYTEGRDLRHDYTEGDLLKMAEEMSLEFAPGEKWKYSNTGYVLLGLLIHNVTGEFYGDFLHERIFAPLGMDTARIINEDDIIPNRAAGYELVKGKLRNQRWVSPSLNTTADGSLYVSVIDMSKWDTALRERKLLKPASYELWWTPMRLNDGEATHYGFGWFLETAGRHRLIEHTGAWQGFKSHIARYVDDNLTVIVLMNLDEGDPKKLAHGVAELYGAPKPE